MENYANQRTKMYLLSMHEAERNTPFLSWDMLDIPCNLLSWRKYSMGHISFFENINRTFTLELLQLTIRTWVFLPGRKQNTIHSHSYLDSF